MTTKQRIFEALADCDLRAARSLLCQARKTNAAARKAYSMISNAIEGKIEPMAACIRIKTLIWQEDLP